MVLLRPLAAPAPVAEALVRLRGELLVEGFDAQVVTINLPATADTRGALEQIAPSLGAAAVVAVVAGRDPASVELWVVDRVTGKTVVRRVRAEPQAAGRTAEVLSVRAVELLRASLIELAISAHPAPDATETTLPTTPTVTRFATEPFIQPNWQPDWTWAVEAGVGTMGALASRGGGVGNEIVPVGRVERAFGPHLCARLTFAGLGTQARANTAGGYADVSQTVVLAEALVRFRRGRRLEPVVSVGAGVLRVSAEGHEAAPYLAASGERWAAAGELGVGFRIPLRPRRFEVGVELHAVVAEPYPVVRFFGADIARAGRPTVLSSVTLLGGL